MSAVPGLVQKLRRGAVVGVVGCGGGGTTVAMARSWPASSFIGVDHRPESLREASRLAEEAGVTNVCFLRGRAESLPADRRYELVCSLDGIQAPADPCATFRTLRRLLGRDGDLVWSAPGGPTGGTIVDEESARTLAARAGFSSFRCLPDESSPHPIFLLKR